MIDCGLKVGKTYVDGYGEKHTITDYSVIGTGTYPYLSDTHASFTPKGRYWEGIISVNDLVKEVEPDEVTETPKVEHGGIGGGLKVGKTYVDGYGDKHTIVSSDGYGKFYYSGDLGFSFTHYGLNGSSPSKRDLVKEVEPDIEKIQLQVGKTYVDGYGDTHTIMACIESEPYPYRSDKGITFTKRGLYRMKREGCRDLVKEVEPDEVTETSKVETNNSGGPRDYYDFKSNYQTLNDVVEDKSKEQWVEDTWHLGNILKAVWRWGSKGGTTKEYDAEKIIYSACRILKSRYGAVKLRSYLNKILDDPQFSD